jgi:hypothetical protein
MRFALTDFVPDLQRVLERAGVPEPKFTAEACTFLEACGYPGLSALQEALGDKTRELKLVRDVLGLDLKDVSCVFLAKEVGDYVAKNGRIYLRNVRHGLYLLPDSVASNYGIGCPIDPSFHLGGDRLKNPYAEKWEAASRDGIEVDEALWAKLAA